MIAYPGTTCARPRPHLQTHTGRVGASVWSEETTRIGSTQVSFQGRAERRLFARHSLAGLRVTVYCLVPQQSIAVYCLVDFWLARNWCARRSDDTRIALWSIFQDEH